MALGVGPAAAGSGGQYADRAKVQVVANKIGPYYNPSETYAYFSLPFCVPEHMEHHSHNLGEILSGDRKVVTAYDVQFKVPYEFRRLCKKTLSAEEVEAFQVAIDEDYYFEMLVDNLPVWGYVGVIQTPSAAAFLSNGEQLKPLEEIDISSRRFLYTHLVFTISYNKDRIIGVSLTSSPERRVDITEAKPVEVDFSYEVTWQETKVPFSERVEKYQKAEFLPATFEIHWLSIINSFVLVVLLTVFLAIILMRVLKNDFTRYMQADEEEELVEDESGWKQIHGDVFRFPENKNLFAAILGAGTHLLCTSLLVLVLALFSIFSPTKKGAISTVGFVLYALTSGTSGYVAVSMYMQMGGTKWVWNTILTAILFPGPLFCMFCVLNTIAISYDSTAALPFGTIMLVFCVYLLVTFPLTVLGAIMGKRHAKPFDAPCRTNKAARGVPDMPWYRGTALQMLIAGFLPFSAIYIELHYIFSSIWGHKVYTLFGILFLALVMLLIVTCFITVALIYFQLAAEEHRWWWRSILYGGSSGFFVYLYSFFYYYERSKMSGLLQTSFYFGYMLIVSYAFFLILGTVGFFSSLTFVRSIYQQLKLD
ncbi:Transmembrane 9 superfamily member 3 (Endomembrane protein 9) (Transmembrane nine protein 3) (AtTMN3) [Durusdinium trenchii]|uniref:Transmembrane 9 superfamily member n=1 Tax=Durusdinium trenchii TaxID=1381693 RepID=A0ABP0H8U8_9DINO